MWSLDINAMNFCRMSLCPLGSRPLEGQGEKAEDHVEEDEALVAVPSLTKDEVVRRLPCRVSLNRKSRTVADSQTLATHTGRHLLPPQQGARTSLSRRRRVHWIQDRCAPFLSAMLVEVRRC